MAPPNLKNPTSIIGKTSSQNSLSGSEVTLVTNPVGSGKVMKINSIYCTNTDAGPTYGTITVRITEGSSFKTLVSNMRVLEYCTQIVTTRDTYFYLEEGQSLIFIGYYFTVTVGYEEIS